MGWLMGPIYYSISWILIQWHALWDLLIPGAGLFLATNWPWILAIVFLVITVRIILFPIFVKQIRSQRAMQALQPKMKELQEKYKGDQQTLRQEMMKLYQTEKVNPLMGCLPMFLQIPVFLGLFHVLKYLNPLTEKDPDKLYGWTSALFESAAYSKLFDAPISMAFRSSSAEVLAVDGSVMAVKVVSALLVITMMFTTFLTSRQMILKTGWQADPQQRMIQKLMLYGIPISLLLSGWYFPIGVIVYWVTQNIFSLGQQHWVLRKYPPPVTATSGAKSVDALRKSVVTRFFVGEPLRVPPAPARGGVVSPVQPVSRFGFLRRRKTDSAVMPVLEQRSLAPKPGAKPTQTKAVPPKPAAVDAPQTEAVSEAVSPNGSAPSGNGTPTQATKATPAPDAPAAAPAGATPGGSGGQKTTGQKSGGQKPTGQKSAGQRGGGQRKSTASRKGAGSKKGGPRR